MFFLLGNSKRLTSLAYGSVIFPWESLVMKSRLVEDSTIVSMTWL